MNPLNKEPPDTYQAASALLQLIGVKATEDQRSNVSVALSLFWHDGFKANNRKPEKKGNPEEIHCSCSACKEYLYANERRPVIAIHSSNDVGFAAAIAVNEGVDAHAYVCQCGVVTLDLREDRVEDKRKEPGVAG